MPDGAGTPTVLIEGPAETMVLHLWENISIRDEMEMTDKPTLGGGRDQEVVRKLPPSFRVSVKVADELVVPVVKDGAVHQDDITMLEQIQKLRSLIGSTITITAEKFDQSVTGVVRSVEISDNGRYDNVSRVNLEVRSFARSEQADGLILGDIVTTKVNIPLSIPDPGVDDVIEQEYGIPEAVSVADALPGAGDCEVKDGKSFDLNWGDALVGAARGAARGAALGAAPGAVIGGIAGGTSGLLGVGVFGDKPQSAKKNRPTNGPPEDIKKRIKIHSNGDLFLDGKDISPADLIPELIENSSGDMINLHHDVPRIPINLWAPDEVSQIVGVVSNGQDVSVLKPEVPDLRDVVIETIKGHIPKNQGGTGELIDDDTPPLPPDSYRFFTGDIATYRQIESGKTFSQVHGHGPPNADLLVSAEVFAAFSTRAFKNTLSKFADHPTYGEC